MECAAPAARVGGWGGGWARLPAAAIRRSRRCSRRRRRSPAWPPGAAAAPGPGSVAGGLGRTWALDQRPKPLPGRIPSPREHPTAGGLRREPAEASSRVGAPRGLQPPRGTGTRHWMVRLHSPAKRRSPPAGLAFLQHFLEKSLWIGKRKAWHLQAQGSPKKLFPKLALQRRPEHPSRERCKLPPGPGVGGRRELVRSGAGPGCRARLQRRARRARCALGPAQPTGGRGASRGSVCPLAPGSERPLRAARCGCSGFSCH